VTCFEPKRKFKGVWIPAEVWLDRDLSIVEKVMLTEIDSLDDVERGCYAKNAYFAEFFNLSKSRVSEIISGLEQKRLISVELKYKAGTKQVQTRIIRLTRPLGAPVSVTRGPDLPPFDNSNTGSDPFEIPKGCVRESEYPPSENTQGNNTNNNNPVETDTCPSGDGRLVTADVFAALTAADRERLVERVFVHWQNSMASPRSLLDAKRRAILNRALRTYGLDTTLNAITGCSRSHFHMGRDDQGRPIKGKVKYNDLSLIFREAEKTERFLRIYEDPTANTRQDLREERFDPTLANARGTQSTREERTHDRNRDVIEGQAERLD